MDEQLIPNKPGEWLYVVAGRTGLVALRARVDEEPSAGGGVALVAAPVAALGAFGPMTTEEWTAAGVRWAGRVPTDGELASRRLGLDVL